MQEVALRDNAGKPRIDYLLKLPKSLEGLCRIFEHGASKYDDGNWKLGGKPDSEYLASCMRHLLQFANGETYDPTTGCNHILHSVWNLLVLVENNHCHEIIDVDNFNKMITHYNALKAEKEIF